MQKNRGAGTHLKLHFNFGEASRNPHLRKRIAQLPQNLHFRRAERNYCGMCTYKKMAGGTLIATFDFAD